MNKVFMCVDLKSFYASVECIERKLNPMTTNLVVADSSRTDKTVCLAITPSLKKYGIGGRARLYEVKSKVREINKKRSYKNRLINKSYDDNLLSSNPNLELDFIIAPPRMRLYMKYSRDIYKIYLKYISKDDIYTYSIDEVFCDITSYLKISNISYEDFATKILLDIHKTTGITATCGIGTNLFLAKVAMDVEAKHMDENKSGVRIAYLDEMSFRKKLWHHKPITDIWRIGKGISNKLEKLNIYTLGDLALFSLENEKYLFKIFGINAEILIDHAWGYEICTIKDIKNYKPKTSSISTSQVLHKPYNYEKALIIVKEMTDSAVLDLVNKKLLTDHLVLTINYDISNLNNNSNLKTSYDNYNRLVPIPSHGTQRLSNKTNNNKIIINNMINLYKKITNKELLIRRVSIAFCSLEEACETDKYKQLDIFSIKEEKETIEKKDDKKLQEAILKIKNKYGKNSILKGMNYLDGSTTKDRNKQVGGHKG